MSEQVIELSIEETNKLRAELGLAPLRVTRNGKTTAGAASIDHYDNPDTKSPSAANAAAAATAEEDTFTAKRTDDNVLELSIEETNKLRAKLGLAPLRETSSSSPRTLVVHAPAHQSDAEKAAVDRIEKARLERQVKEGMEKFAAQKSLAEEGESNALSWAQQMRSKNKESHQKTTSSLWNDAKKERKKDYGEEDVKGLRVAHNLSEIELGSETILTLQDASLLQTDDVSRKVLGLREDYDEDVELENVNLAEQSMTTDALRQKRKLELGMGRAGGYAGFDDDEFEELGGSQAPSRLARGTVPAATDESNKKKKKSRGFQIGAMLEEQEAQQESDLFAGVKGKSVSLQPSQADVTMSDYMTEEEAKAEQSKKNKKKEKYKDKKEFKKQKKDKKNKKKRSTNLSDDEDDNEQELKLSKNTNKGILDELEATAVADDRAARKRRRVDEDEEELIKEKNPGDDMDLDKIDKEKAEKRAKFAAAMAKSNERTRLAFQTKEKRPVPATSSHVDEEPDDAFLNAALAKARRLNRLKELAESKKPVRGAEAVVEAINAASAKQDTTSSGGGTVVFEVDETREFTRALRAKGNQRERDQAKKASKTGNVSIKKEEGEDEAHMASVDSIVKQEDMEEDADMEELAKEVEEDEEGVGALDGATGTSMAIGRGLGGVLNMLKQTGELTRRNAGKEEMRGRAKDKRTYEDYEPLDLSKVVKIDGRTASEKDKDLASREVKLEYRDKHGRLLTRHEAFRELSYQFHGYGSGKRKEEKKKEQIAREQAEARLASRQASEGGGVFGALMATQKATGKAFVVHKT